MPTWATGATSHKEFIAATTKSNVQINTSRIAMTIVNVLSAFIYYMTNQSIQLQQKYRIFITIKEFRSWGALKKYWNLVFDNK